MSASYADTTVVRQSRVPAALVLVVAVTTGACAARSAGGPTPRPFPGAALPPAAVPEATPAPPSVSTIPGRADLAAAPGVVATALKFLGIPYRNGGSDPSGFDCSGFVQYVFAQLGMALPREVRDQYGVGSEIKLSDVKAGDLLFFETVSRGASHVGMALDSEQFVHAPSSRGVVRVERYSAPYWASRFIGARRVAEPTASAGGGLPGTVRLRVLRGRSSDGDQAATSLPLRTTCRELLHRNSRITRSSSVNRAATRGTLSGSTRQVRSAGGSGCGSSTSV